MSVYVCICERARGACVTGSTRRGGSHTPSRLTALHVHLYWMQHHRAMALQTTSTTMQPTMAPTAVPGMPNHSKAACVSHCFQTPKPLISIPATTPSSSVGSMAGVVEQPAGLQVQPPPAAARHANNNNNSLRTREDKTAFTRPYHMTW